MTTSGFTITASFNWQQADNGYKNSKHMAEGEVMKGVARKLDAVMVNPGVVIGPGDVHFNGGKLIRSVKKHQAFFYIKGGNEYCICRGRGRRTYQRCAKRKKRREVYFGGRKLDSSASLPNNCRSYWRHRTSNPDADSPVAACRTSV